MEQEKHPALKFFIFFSLLLLGVAVSSVIISASLSDYRFSELISNFDEHPFELLASQAIIHLCVFILAPIAFITFIEKESIKLYLGLNSPINKSVIFYSIVLLLSIQAITSSAAEYSKLLPLGDTIHRIFLENQTANDAFTKAILEDTSISMFILQIITMGLLAGIGEEMVFRGIFQRLFHQWSKNIHFSIVFSAILFAVFHGLIYNIFGIVIIGIIFGYIYYFTGNLWITIGLHILNNSAIVVISYLNAKGLIDFDISETNIFSGIEISISVLITIFAMQRIYKNRQVGLKTLI
ncbi:MAG: CPBP family intramembrane metalloprotease [Chitinophagales bacterium]|nr:CPBP family intramembrane metalloprotease [Chitinophagales bacterium]